MKRKPYKSILLLIGYLLVLMVLFNVYAIKADAYYEHDNGENTVAKPQTINEPFHHLVITSQNSDGLNVDIRPSDSASMLIGSETNDLTNYEVTNDTLFLRIQHQNQYISLDLLVQHPLRSLSANNVPLHLTSDLFDCLTPLSLRIASDNSAGKLHSHLSLNAQIQDLDLDLQNCAFTIGLEPANAGIIKLNIDAINCDITTDWIEGVAWPQTTVTSDVLTTFRAPVGWLKTIQWQDAGKGNEF
jgi:hypothetical protein